MGGAIVGAVAVVLVAAVTGLFGVLGGRNDRAQAHQEADLLAKLDPNSNAAKQLSQVIESRISVWHQRRPRRRGALGQAALSPWPYLLALALFLFLLAVQP